MKTMRKMRRRAARKTRRDPPRKPVKKVQAIIDELQNWLPNYDYKQDYPQLLMRILASLPGGEQLEGMGVEPFELGWHEADQLARVLDAIEGKWDVEDIVQHVYMTEE